MSAFATTRWCLIVGVGLGATAFGQDAGALVEQKFGFATFLVAIGSMLALGHLLKKWTPEVALPLEPRTA